MKKLIVLAAVFAFASAADATVLTWSEDSITLTLSGSDTVQIIADDDQPYEKSVGNSPSTIASISDIEPLPAAGSEASAVEVLPGWWTLRLANENPPPPSGISSGPQWNVTIQAGSVTGTYRLDTDYYGTNDILEITVVPEPMTIALLALGSLGLLRKRRR